MMSNPGRGEEGEKRSVGVGTEGNERKQPRSYHRIECCVNQCSVQGVNEDNMSHTQHHWVLHHTSG